MLVLRTVCDCPHGLKPILLVQDLLQFAEYVRETGRWVKTIHAHPALEPGRRLPPFTDSVAEHAYGRSIMDEIDDVDLGVGFHERYHRLAEGLRQELVRR